MAHDNTYYLAKAPIWRSMLHLCIPMMAALSVGVVYNIVNAGFVGSLHDTSMLAALTFGLPILTVVMAVGGMFGAGGSAEIARQLGAAETDPAARDRARRVAGFVLYGSLATGIVLAITALLLLDRVVVGLGTDPGSMHATTRYVTGMLIFAPVMIATFAVDQLVRAEGAATASSVGMIASTVANVVLDAVFILGLHLDVLGAALGMGLANLLALVYFLWWLQRRSVVLSIAPRWFTLRPEVVRPVLTIGASELLMSSFLFVSSLTLNHVAVRYGDASLAAFGVAQRIVQLPEMLAMSIAIGVLPLLAYTHGAKRTLRLRRALVSSGAAIAGLVGVFSTALLVWHDHVFSAFSDNAGVVALGATIMVAMLVSTFFNGFTALLMTWFQASEQGGRAAILGTLQGGLFIPVILVMSGVWGLDGVIWTMPVAEMTACLVGVGLLATGAATLARRPVTVASGD